MNMSSGTKFQEKFLFPRKEIEKLTSLSLSEISSSSYM